jgi:hypothetical protein
VTFVRRHPLVSFFVLAYGLSWAYWIPLAVAGVRTAPGSSTTHEPGLLGPALAAFIIAGLTEGRSGIVAFGKRLVLVSRPTSQFLDASVPFGRHPNSAPRRCPASAATPFCRRPVANIGDCTVISSSRGFTAHTPSYSRCAI